MSAPPSPVAIVGAGYLGASVAQSLTVPVLATTRSGDWRGEQRCPAHVSLHRLDLCDRAMDPTPLATSQTVVVCVAPGRTQDRRTLYVDGTLRLLNALKPQVLQRIVWVSSTSALPDRDAWLDESCPEDPQSERGQVQRDAEHVVRDFATTYDIPWLVLRLGGLYGPGRELSRIYRRRTSGPLPGHGMAPTNLVHRDDAVAAVCAAAAAAAHIQGIVHVVDDDHTPRRIMYDRIAQHTGQPPLDWSDPPPAGSTPDGKRVSNRRLKHWLGIHLRVPLHQLDDHSGP